MEPVGRIIATFYDICNEIWRSLQATESHKSKNTSGGRKAGENDQPEELSNARNGFGYDDNEGENFDVEKHCKILSGVSINSNERQSQNKTAIYISQDQNKLPNPVDTGRKLNVHKKFRRRPRRLLNVLCTFNLRPVSMGKGQTSSSRDETNVEEVLIEKMEKHN